MSLGTYLKRERERRHVSVAELAQTTRIPVRVLRHLENDEHEELPADVFVRGYLRAYARALNIPEERLLSRLGTREESDAPPPLTAVYAPESGRKFGIAIALFILLILFTLALSIVLRPRHRDTPVELSRAPDQVPTQVWFGAPAPHAGAAADAGGVVSYKTGQCRPASSAKPCSCAVWITATPTASSLS